MHGGLEVIYYLTRNVTVDGESYDRFVKAGGKIVRNGYCLWVQR